MPDFNLNPSLGIRKATEWYNSHLPKTRSPIRGQASQVPTVVLMTEDAANRQTADKSGIPVISGRKILSYCFLYD